MIKKSDWEVREAIAYAFDHAISVVGIDGLRKTSMFPSNERAAYAMKRAA